MPRLFSGQRTDGSHGDCLTSHFASLLTRLPVIANFRPSSELSASAPFQSEELFQSSETMRSNKPRIVRYRNIYCHQLILCIYFSLIVIVCFFSFLSSSEQFTAKVEAASFVSNEPHTASMPRIDTIGKIKSRMASDGTQLGAKISPSSGHGLQRDQQQCTNNLSSETVLTMLSRMTYFFYSMIDPTVHRFYYRCLPDQNKRIHSWCPIRDMGSAWDTTTLLGFWRRQQKLLESTFPASAGPTWPNIERRLSKAVKQTVHGYGPWAEVTKADTGNNGSREVAIISTKLLQEPSNIAHSAFLTLTTLGALRLNIVDPKACKTPINALINGILSMERDEPTGAFAIHFGSGDTYSGIEFYPGEALLSLLDAYEYHEDDAAAASGIILDRTAQKIIPAAKRSFTFYSDYYRQGNVDDRYTSFFGNWQVQCFGKLYNVLVEQERHSEAQGPVQSKDVARYIFELCDSIVASRSWEQLRKGHYKSTSTVEIACGLEALADGTRIALDLSATKDSSQSNRQVAKFWPSIVTAVQFIQMVQNQAPDKGIGSGGLGHALHLSEQRLDVTGHSINALVKVYDLQERIEHI